MAKYLAGIRIFRRPSHGTAVSTGGRAMRVRWFGQSAFLLSAGGQRVFIDPFGPMGAAMAARGIRFDYPAIAGVEADLLLVTHEHADHNGVEAIGGSPRVIRSTAGTFDSPVGRVTAVASEHDAAAGTLRGPNVIFAFEFGGLRVCHFGDFGQSALRPEQAEAIGRVDLLLLPVGAGPTIGPDGAMAVVRRLRPSWVVPMHYRSAAIGFLEPVDPFLALFADARLLEGPEFDTAALAPAPGEDAVLLVPAVPA